MFREAIIRQITFFPFFLLFPIDGILSFRFSLIPKRPYIDLREGQCCWRYPWFHVLNSRQLYYWLNRSRDLSSRISGISLVTSNLTEWAGLRVFVRRVWPSFGRIVKGTFVAGKRRGMVWRLCQTTTVCCFSNFDKVKMFSENQS